MVPHWLLVVSWTCLVLAILCASDIAFDIWVRRYRQPMRVMEAVWPVTALYFGPVASWAYRRFGRPASRRWQREHHVDGPPDKPRWATTAIGVTHCGAGCTLGDIVAEFIVFGAAITIASQAVFAEMIGDYLLAVLLGVAFQYFAIAPMRGLGLRKGLAAAVKGDILSLTAFEVGLFGWMLLMAFVFFPSPHLHPNQVPYWFLMQVGMVIGFFTAWPANAWLIRRGIKEAM